MQWASKPKLSLKAERAALLSLSLSSLLLRAGERVSLLDPALPEARGRGALRRLAEALAPPPATASAAPSFPPLRPLPRHAALVAISDFLAPMADIEASFKPYAGRISAGVLVQLLDPAELSLPYQGRIEFSGLEGEGSVLLPKTEALRQAYRKQLAARRDALSSLARAAGWSYVRQSTETPAASALLPLYLMLTDRVQGFTRARSASRGGRLLGMGG